MINLTKSCAHQMAEQGQTVRVSGLPTDIEDDRLTDKLFIHFLRTKNGGGEIASVTIVKATPGSAFITFEDSNVAQSVLQHGRHILEVNRKKYELTLSEHHKDLDPNKVILSMSVTVDYSQLPQGKIAVTSLHRSHPDVQINYNPPEELCTLRGLYSEVQAAVAQLLGLPRSSGSPDTPFTGSNGAERVSTCRESTVHRRRDVEQRERTEQAFGLISGDRGFGPYTDLASRGHSWDVSGEEEGGAVGLRLPEDPTMVEEDLSLIMDADMFLYLQRHCGEEYQHILRQHGVEVVDVTSQGVTTLFLQSGAAMGEMGRKLERLRGARGDLSRLYQENETRLRRAQLPKSVLCPRGGLQRTMENLQVRLPKLLLSEDDRNVYIVGSSSDVSDAKQFLLLDQGEREEGGDDVASLLRFPSYPSNFSRPTQEERLTPTLSSTAGALDPRIDKMLKTYEAERKAERARGYKLAARFKDTGVGGLATRPGDTLTAGVPSPSIRSGLGPMLGHEPLFGSERVGLGIGGVKTQNTGEDILFKRGDPLVSATTLENRPSLSSIPMSSGQRDETCSLTTTQNPLSGGTKIPPSGSGTTLKRASSFSGRARPKAQDTGQSEAGEETGKATTRVRARSSSFSNRTGKDRQDIFSAEVAVPTVMWNYMKEAYATRLQDMTSNLQMKDSQSEGSREYTVTLRGAESSGVRACQLELQKLVTMVATDFCVQELRLAELGVADSTDETLVVCCAEVRCRFKKVSIQTLRESVFLIGPKQLCIQVGAALREVFSGEAGQREGQEDFSVPSTSTLNQSIPPQVNGIQNPTLFQNNSPQHRPETQRGEEEGTGQSREEKNVQRSDSTKTQRNRESEGKTGVGSQSSARKEPVINEKVERGGTMEIDGSKTDKFLNHSAKGNRGGTGPVNGTGLMSLSTSAYASQDTVTTPKDSNLKSKVTQRDNRQSTGPEKQEESGGALTRHGPGMSSMSRAQGTICVCGESQASVKRTGCGVSLCPQCLLKVHVHCKVCPKAEAVPQGIHGNMTYSEMAFTLQGHGRDSTVKITYCIPDGIQGANHPSPGATFQGGLFEAYLPHCERTKRLLLRLEKAFRLGLTFTVIGKEDEARVIWDCIPHKTSLQGGKSGNGYPDSSYLSRLSEALTAHGIEEAPDKSQDTNKT